MLIMTARIAGNLVAIPSDMVESVVRIGTIVPVPCVDAAIVGLFAVRSRVLTLYDPGYHLRGGAPATDTMTHAVVLSGQAIGYALLVDAVEDVVQHDGCVAPCERLPPEWLNIAVGIIDVGSERRILVDVTTMLASLEQHQRAA